MGCIFSSFRIDVDPGVQGLGGDMQLDMPALGLGTWKLRGEPCRRTVARALSIGYRHVDTAQGYQNEEEVGAGIRDSGVARESVWITTKVWVEDVPPRETIRAVEQSLRRLRVEYLDLVLVHWPSRRDGTDHNLHALRTVQNRGQVRNIGVSNFPPDLWSEAIDRHGPLNNQIEYHPYLVQPDLLRMAHRRRATITAYSPLAQGRVRDDPVLREIGAHREKSASQVCLRWLLQQPRVAAIPKASSPDHLEETFEVQDFSLDDEEMRRIFALSAGLRLIDPPFAPWR